MKYILVVAITMMFVFGGGFLYVHHMLYSETAPATETQNIIIEHGESVKGIAKILKKHDTISSTWAFLLYLKIEGGAEKIKAGQYSIKPTHTIENIVNLLGTGTGKSRDITVTFPEGWNIKQIADRLEKKGFDGNKFIEVVSNPSEELLKKFQVTQNLSKGTSLEGYLFPDTYNFLPEMSGEEIATEMIGNFEKKYTDEMRKHIKKFNQSIHDIVIMASIIEREVSKSTDRDLVSGVFYNRLRDNMPLQSDATLDYIFGESKMKHTIVDTQVDSPYNTYKYAGLPKGPIGSPGEAALKAATYPEKTEYYYFLNNVDTGKTVFSKTFEEHVRNKNTNGL